MKIQTLHKKGIICACGCGEELASGHWSYVTMMNKKYYKMYCARVYRLHVASIRWIKEKFLG